MSDDFDPREALAVAQVARDRVAARAVAPAWYGMAYGLACGGIVAGGGWGAPWGLLLLAVGVAALGLLYAQWQRLTGLSVNGFRKGRTRIVATLLTLALVGLMLAGLILSKGYGLGWAPLAAGAVAVPVSILAAMAWDRAWRREILAGAAQ